MNNSRYGSRCRRRGLSMAIVLAALVAVTLLATTLTRAIVIQTRVARNHALQSQAAWLAESGASRAAAMLQADREYRGETWQIAADELGGVSGVVVIEVQPPADSGNLQKVRIEARYPDEATHRALCVKELAIRTAAEEESP